MSDNWDEGWTPQHDDAHRKGEMAGAAACYAMHGLAIQNDRLAPRAADMVRELWPWAQSWWKPKNRRRDLIRAAALIVAEVERLAPEALQHVVGITNLFGKEATEFHREEMKRREQATSKNERADGDRLRDSRHGRAKRR